MQVSFALEQAAARQRFLAACQPVFASLRQIFAVHCPVLQRKHCVLIHSYHTSS